MAHKHLMVQSAAREKILHGVMALVDAMKVTLGPKSKCVLIEKKWGRPLVCNDGVTIAKEFELEDHEENLGAQVIRQAAERTGDMVFRPVCRVGAGERRDPVWHHAVWRQQQRGNGLRTAAGRQRLYAGV